MFDIIHHSEYEFFLKDGNSFTLNDVTDLSIEYEGKRINKLNIKGSDVRDKLIFINIDEISCIIKRKTKKVRKWKK